ncbi:YicC/YloC family endoribonuclease [Roseovarius sp. EL26]|uniref:YicC/YloC family endoribonuclease n=1 Tax=Roseovarius sp. EL26 TaxID=2126672 RepID=UPI0020B124B1|nr:YicC/YloC family endoribonuclease [Roseovarius sp. EL26]
MLNSMTGFASAKGSDARYSWTWELRSVNGKGLDIRQRVPDWVDGLEAALRARMGKALGRGNVSLSLRIQSDEMETTQSINQANLTGILTHMAEVEQQAMTAGVSLAPATSADVLSIRGVLENRSNDQDTKALLAVLQKDFEPLLQSFIAMRATEGQALTEVLQGQMDQIDTLTTAAGDVLEERRDDMQAAFRASLARVMDNTDGTDETRIAQELAMLAVKTDITEELDRLRAHITAARDLIAKGSPVGRKLDFLAQEFNREANTLCSKAQNSALTAIGLELKTVIDQMREQVQNVE